MSKKKISQHVSLPLTELRPLLFWAMIGVNGSYNGSYAKKIEEIIAHYAKAIRFQLRMAKFKEQRRRGHDD